MSLNSSNVWRVAGSPSDSCESESHDRENKGLHRQPYSPQALSTNEAQDSSNNESVRSGGDASPEAVEAQRLLARLTSGDFTSFYGLWKDFQPSLYRVCLKQMSGRREEAEDALSRAMLIAWERLPRHVHAIRDIKAWLSRLTSNLCLDILREHKRYSAVFEGLDEVYAPSHQLKASIETPEEFALRNELSLNLSDSINNLPPKLRSPFLLRFVQDMSYSDISARLNLSAENTRKRVQQARSILRNKLHQYRFAKGHIAGDDRHQKFKRDDTDLLLPGKVEEVVEAAVEAVLPAGIGERVLVNSEGETTRSPTVLIRTLKKPFSTYAGVGNTRSSLATLLYETSGQGNYALEEHIQILKGRSSELEADLGMGKRLYLPGRSEEPIKGFLVSEAGHPHGLAGCGFEKTSGIYHVLGESYLEIWSTFDDASRGEWSELLARRYIAEALLKINRLVKARHQIILSAENANRPAPEALVDERRAFGIIKGKHGEDISRLLREGLQPLHEWDQTRESQSHLVREWIRTIDLLRMYLK